MIQVTICRYGRETVNGTWVNDTPCGLTRLYYVLDGVAEIFNGKKLHILQKNHCYLFTQSEDFHIVDGKAFDHVYFDFYASFSLEQDCFLDLADPDPFFSIFSCMKTVTFPVDSATPRLLLETVLNYLNETYDLPYVTNRLVLQAVALIQAEYATVTTRLLSERLCVNESYLIRLFRKIMGLSPMQYIRSCRLSHGLLLLNGNETIERISELCGYQSPSAFTKAFKDEFGKAPSQIR